MPRRCRYDRSGARHQACQAASPSEASLHSLTKTSGDASSVSGHDFSRAVKTSSCASSRLQPATQNRQEGSRQASVAAITDVTSQAEAADKSLCVNARLKACSTQNLRRSLFVVLFALIQICSQPLLAQDADPESWFSLTSEKTYMTGEKPEVGVSATTLSNWSSASIA